MSRYKKDLGDFGENAAANYLIKKGYKILCRNYSIKGGEIDLIAETDTHIVFVEVKTRTSDTFGTPAEAVTKTKQQHILKSAKVYLTENPSEKEVSFDIIEVYAKFNRGLLMLKDINHIADVIMEA